MKFKKDVIKSYPSIELKNERQWMLYENVFVALEKYKVRYLVVGGIGVNLHGFARPTVDLDLIISFSEKNVNQFIDVVKKIGFSPRVPVAITDLANEDKRKEWIETKGMVVFTLFNPKNLTETVDILVQQDLDFETAYKNRKEFSLGKIKVKVGAISDLIKMKKKAGRARDLRDIEGLKEIESLQKKKKKS